jgi:hypothetical protein
MMVFFGLRGVCNNSNIYRATSVPGAALILEFPAAEKMAGNLCGSCVNQAIPARIGVVASKACAKFPVQKAQEVFHRRQGIQRSGQENADRMQESGKQMGLGRAR